MKLICTLEVQSNIYSVKYAARIIIIIDLHQLRWNRPASQLNRCFFLLKILTNLLLLYFFDYLVNNNKKHYHLKNLNYVFKKKVSEIIKKYSFLINPC